MSESAADHAADGSAGSERRSAEVEEHRRRIAEAEAARRDARIAPIQIEARDRSWIARWIIAIFAGTVLGSFVTSWIEGAVTGAWEQAATRSSDLVRSAVLPVVTLVLGYYFGRSASPAGGAPGPIGSS